MIRMAMRVEVARALPAGERVYLAGSPATMGRWDPAGVPLRRTADRVWEADVLFEAPGPFECKVTRGSWDTEAADEFGHIPANAHLEAVPDGTVTLRAAGWKDGFGAPPRPRIVGNWIKLPQVKSRWLDRARDVIVWFPPGYDERPRRKYPVLYLHDARQVFDPTTSTWGHDWMVDDYAQDMILGGELEPFIAVAADCTPDRDAEYDPARLGDAYLRFLADELKPMVDARWRTDPARTSIAGSSMGGLISFYAAWTRPDLWTSAACLSPAFCANLDVECLRMVRAAAAGHLPLPKIRLFLSCGGKGDLEAELLKGTLRMVDALKLAHFPEKSLSVRIEAWAEHNEAAWSRMTPRFLRFLYGHPRG